jgi:hypothetical protein
MISDNVLWNTKASDDVVEEKESCSTTIIQKGRHSLNPFFEVINDNDDITMPPN